MWIRKLGHLRSPEVFDTFGPEDLTERIGCAVHLVPAGEGRFTGSTRGEACASDRAGASYATSEVVLEPGRLTSWDRGFDVEGTQVWGAVKGAYVFDRISEGPPE